MKLSFEELVEVLQSVFNPIIESKFKIHQQSNDYGDSWYVLFENDESGETIRSQVIY